MLQEPRAQQVPASALLTLEPGQGLQELALVTLEKVLALHEGARVLLMKKEPMEDTGLSTLMR